MYPDGSEPRKEFATFGEAAAECLLVLGAACGGVTFDGADHGGGNGGSFSRTLSMTAETSEIIQRFR